MQHIAQRHLDFLPRRSGPHEDSCATDHTDSSKGYHDPRLNLGAAYPRSCHGLALVVRQNSARLIKSTVCEISSQRPPAITLVHAPLVLAVVWITRSRFFFTPTLVSAEVGGPVTC